MIQNHITEILSLLTGAIAGLFGYRQFLSTQKKSEMESALDVYKALHKELRESDEKCKKELSELREDLSDLKSQLIVIQTAYHDLPFPMWLKDMELKMIVVNSEYEKCFLIPQNKRASDYIGKTDTQIWGEELGKEFQKNDLKVLKSKTGYWYGEENISINGINVSDHWKIVKYIRYSGNIPIGVGGIAIPV